MLISSLVGRVVVARDRWRRLGSGHEPVYVVSPAGDTVYALHRWGLRELDIGPAGARERHVVVSAVLSDLLGCAAPRALVCARLEDEGATAGGASTTALTASDLRAWVLRTRRSCGSRGRRPWAVPT